MDSLLNVFLFDSDKKNYLVAYSLYIVLCTLITAKMVAAFDITYSYPSSIDLAMAISFILSGDVIVPMVVFFLITSLANTIIGLPFTIIYHKVIKHTKANNVVSMIIYFAEQFNWFTIQEGKLLKLKKFHVYEDLYNSFSRKEFDILSFTKSYFTITILLLTNVVLYDIQPSVKYALAVGLTIYAVYSVFNVFLLYIIKDNLMYFEELESDQWIYTPVDQSNNEIKE